MTAPIDFYFDFSSPYGYIASAKIDAIGAKHGREVDWHAILLGAVFKVTGGQPFADLPLKGDYGKHDVARSARLHGVPYRPPSHFPIATLAPARAFYWATAQGAAQAKALTAALYRAYFVDDRDISKPETVVEVAQGVGLDASALSKALSDAAVKERLRSETDAAIARGVFGSPFVIVDGEPFWGADRLDQVEHWLKTGGW